MSDRTCLRVWVYDIPEDQKPAALEVLQEDYALELEYEPDVLWRDPFYAGEITVSTGWDIAAQLHKAAPGASYMLIEYPSSLYLGEVYAYTPALGSYGGDCDNEGQPVYNHKQVAEMIREAGTGRHVDDLLAALGKAMGEPWFEDWLAHTAPAVVAGTVQETGQ